MPDLEFRINEDISASKERNPWLAFVPEYARGDDGREYMRVAGRTSVYRLVKRGKFEVYVCNSCGSGLETVEVVHPIRVDRILLPAEECEYETVPYCSKCEEKPSVKGLEITIG